MSIKRGKHQIVLLLTVFLVFIGVLLLTSSQSSYVSTGYTSHQTSAATLVSNLPGLGVQTPLGLVIKTDTDLLSYLQVAAAAGSQTIPLSKGFIKINGRSLQSILFNDKLLTVIDEAGSGQATLTYTATTSTGQTLSLSESFIIDNTPPVITVQTVTPSQIQALVTDQHSGSVVARVGYSIPPALDPHWLDASAYTITPQGNGILILIPNPDPAKNYYVIAHDPVFNVKRSSLSSVTGTSSPATAFASLTKLPPVTGLVALTGFQTKEPGTKEPGKPGRPTGNPICGNGKREGNEQCDPPGAHNQCAQNQVCNTQCQCQAIPTCGNGKLDSGEQCEQGTTNTCPALFICQPNCQCRLGDSPTTWYPGAYSGYSYTPIQASLFCGNSKVELQLGEECDPPNAGPPPTCCPDCKKPYTLFIKFIFRNKRETGDNLEGFALQLRQTIQQALAGTSFTAAGGAIRVHVVDERGEQTRNIGNSDLPGIMADAARDPNNVGNVLFFMYDDVRNLGGIAAHQTVGTISSSSGVTQHSSTAFPTAQPGYPPIITVISATLVTHDISRGVNPYYRVTHELIHQLMRGAGSSTTVTGRDINNNPTSGGHVFTDGNLMIPDDTLSVTTPSGTIIVIHMGLSLEQWQKDIINQAYNQRKCHATTPGSAGGATTNGWFA